MKLDHHYAIGAQINAARYSQHARDHLFMLLVSHSNKRRNYHIKYAIYWQEQSALSYEDAREWMDYEFTASSASA